MAKKEIGFNEAMNGIEQILKNIEEGEPDIDRLSEDVRKAAELEEGDNITTHFEKGTAKSTVKEIKNKK